jgi:hypothetical protein
LIRVGGLPSGPAIGDLDGAGGLLAADQVLRPATRVQGWIDQLGPDVRFPERHAGR